MFTNFNPNFYTVVIVVVKNSRPVNKDHEHTHVLVGTTLTTRGGSDGKFFFLLFFVHRRRRPLVVEEAFRYYPLWKYLKLKPILWEDRSMMDITRKGNLVFRKRDT